MDSGISADTIGGLVLYDGATGKSTFAASVSEAHFSFDPENSNIGFILWNFASLGDGPHGFALVDKCNSVLHFMSYEGSFVATEGFAEGDVSTDIRAQESGTAGASSLQRIGIGFEETRDNNQWVFGKTTPGSSNMLQTFGSCEPVSPISSCCVSSNSFVSYRSRLIPL